MRRYMQYPRTAALLVGLAVALCSCGCATLIQPYPQKNLFAVSAGSPSAVPTGQGTSVLRVQGVRIAEPFDEKTFIYKTGESAFAVDYYNGFIADPSRLLTGELIRWLSQSGLFATVVGGSGVDHDLTLETNITVLYGDYSTKGSAQAVMEARFVLIQERKNAYTVVFQNVYRQAEPIAAEQPEQLVQGWGRAYGRILAQLAADLRAQVAASAPASNG